MGPPPPTPPYFLDLLQRCNCTLVRIITCLKHYYFDPVNPPATFLNFVTHDLLVMLGMLVGHAGDVENDVGDVDELV